MAGITEYCMPEWAAGLKTLYVVLDSSRVDFYFALFCGITTMNAPLFFLRDCLLFVQACAFKLFFVS